MFAGLLHRLDGHAHVPRVVESVENPEDVHAIVGGALHEAAHHIIGIVTVTEQILTPQQHLQAGIGQCLAQGPQAFPGVFLQKAHTGIEGGTAPALEGPVPGFVELVADRQHVFRAHAGGDQALMGVAQNGVGDTNLCHESGPTGLGGRLWRPR